MRPDDLVSALATFLQRLHRSTASPEAVIAGPAEYLARAAERLAAGEVDPDRFDEPYRAHAPERLLTIAGDLAANRPATTPVPVHGGLRLADLSLHDGAVVGWPETPGDRLGDPYVDLVFLACDLAAAIGPAAVPALFDAYGDARPDPTRIEFWVMIRQFLL